ncbi:MAG: hypothetical protein SF162_00995 [bacterium]|nr:hypothetical protein [bacterium]
MLELVFPLDLVRRSGAQGRVEGDIRVVAVGGARADVAPALAIRACARTPTRCATGQFVEVSLQFSGRELTAGLDLLAAFPPVRILILEYRLWAGFGLTEIRRLFL